LTDEETRKVWRRLDTAKMLPRIRMVYRLILVTGQRPGEVGRASWSEFDLDQALWTIPAERSKNGKEHEVPLAIYALDLLAELRNLHDNERWLFPSHHKGKDQPLDARAAAHAIRYNREHFGIPRWTPHDLRRTVRTNLSALGVDHIVAKKVVNHSLHGMDQVYDRHNYLLEKRSALDTWAGRLQEIIEGRAPKVVSIKAA
jgi:integrase